MWRMLSLSVVVCLVCLFSVSAQEKVRVVETETKASFESTRLRVNLVVENPSPGFSAKVRLELLDTDARVITQTEQATNLKNGRQTLQIPLNFTQNDSAELLWYRLRYSVIPNGASDKAATLGVVSLSEIMPEIFELRASAAENVFAGMNYRVRVRAFHPATNLPAEGVRVTGEVSLDVDAENGDDKLKLKAEGTTDREGYTVLNFRIPAAAKLDDDGEIELRGERNGVVREADQDLDALKTQNRVYLNTDKPIYQPNQSFHVRGLLFSQNFNSARAGAEKELEFIIKDEDDTVLYRETVKTSRFGIAGINWKIPESAKLGTYRISVEDDEGDEIGLQAFKVSRYELPNFTVNVKPDKTFYLPDQTTAEITVSADYLFGKPVARGQVKVTQEKDREWNYKEQKWEVEEEKPVTGETDKDGKFVAKFDLTAAHEDLKDSSYRRFEDLRFAAYFTDLSSNRTEARRFDVRVTKDAIHVYLVGVDSYDDHNPKLPIRFYVSTFYADGAPASCDVEIKGKYKDEAETEAKTLTRLKTNAFGAGKVEFSAPKRADEIYNEDLQIKVFAADAQNRNGMQDEDIEMDGDAKAVQIVTKKAIHKPGEPIDLEIFSTEANADVFVDVVKDWSVLEPRLVKLKNGRANLKIPYRADFKGELTISAYIDDHEGDTVRDAKGVIYPAPNNLRLDVAPVQTVYRPNEEAKIKFSVASPGKNLTESALGIVVFDKAIEERARTDADFGGSVNIYGGYSDLLKSKSFGGVSLAAINEMNLRGQKIPDELQLAAEALLADENYYPNFFESGYYNRDLTKVFENHFKKQFSPVETALKNAYEKNFEHPADDASLREILGRNGIDFDALRDPWGEPYRAVFAVERDEDVLYVWSAGGNKIYDRDKTASRSDDFIVFRMRFRYFPPIGKIIDQAVADYHQRTGSFVRDYATLRDELKKQNLDLDALRDRWNHPYKIGFGISGRFFTIDFKSADKDGKFDENSYDDFVVWTNRTDYFQETESRLQAILSNYANETKTFPKSENELREVFRRGGVEFGALRDPWNQPFDLKLETFSRYADKVKTESVTKFGEKPQEKLTITPVTQQVALFRVISAGENAKFGDYDDFTAAGFSGVISEQSKTDAKPVELKTETIFSGGKGAIRGTLTDPQGAVIPNIKVSATNEASNEVFEATTDENGVYLLKNLPSGKYTVKAGGAYGWQNSVVENVPVRSSNLTELNFSLSASGVTSTVNVTSDAQVTVETSSSAVSTQIESLPKGGNFSGLLVTKAGTTDKSKKTGVQINVQTENSTPRLREYFPETLLWQPELVTDKKGRAELKFKLGDNITTWKLYTIASNTDGKIGVAASEIQAFQPFFVDLEPPKVLTVGDRIALPAQVRNYTEKPQKVSVSMASADWFSFLKEASQQIEVAPNATENAVFDFRATRFVKEGKQRVTAIADKDSDAIEKPVFVHPDGQEIVQTRSEIFSDAVSFDVNFPANALPKTPKAELKIYPNLLAHVGEAVEGTLRRPYGCGEQTISSTYPNLMILKVGKNTTLSPGIQEQAQKFLQQGYERLLGYQKAEGGFSIWTKDAPDVALTAYALRFLTDAEDFIEVDENVIERANKWLISQQRADGSWTRIYSWEKVEDKQRTKMLTTYIARILAKTEKDKKEKSKDVQASLRRAFEYLKTRNAEIDEPFALASLALALFDAGDAETGAKITEKLRALAIAEGNGAYWNLETNTPFYGWGTAGRIETTALVVEALIEGKRQKEKGKNEDQKTKTEDQNLIARGTMFLLKNKDKYGVWYSTQATINVLDALLASLSAGSENAGDKARTAEIFVNGQKFRDVSLPPANTLAFPISVVLDSFASNANRVEVKIGGNTSATMAQVVSDHYIGWQDSAQATGRNLNQSRQLRLDYNCDKTDVKIMDEVNCHVEAERIGFRGYGMLLAEIGLPPGADVDRASLEKAKEENWYFSRYDVLPDRIVVYMWAQAGGTKFNFKFRPRYGIEAQTAPSIVYDYYNSEAQATLAPLRFNVK